MLRQRDGDNDGGSGHGLISGNIWLFVWEYQVKPEKFILCRRFHCRDKIWIRILQIINLDFNSLVTKWKGYTPNHHNHP